MKYPFLVLLAISGPLFAQAKKDAPIGPKPIPTANDALLLAWLDFQTLPELDRPFYRYLWISEFTPEKAKALTLGVNYFSRASTPVRLTPLLDGSVIRMDLRRLAPIEKDLQELLEVWEGFRFDPSYNLLITKDMFSAIAKLPIPPTARIRKGNKFETAPFNQLELSGVDVVRLIAPHLNLEAMVGLQDGSGSAAPIVEARYFLYRALTTIKGEGKEAAVWDTIYSGLYYELAGIKESKNAKQTDEDLLFEQLGVLGPGEKIEAVFEKLRSDQRTAVFRRVLNKKPSRIDFIPTKSRRIGEGISFVSVTHDVKDESIDITQHPIMNLDQFKDDAREVIFIKANGMPGYSLYNGQGKLQRFVPQNVAEDRGIPEGNRITLQGAISCIHCHEAKGPDGWQPVGNDVQELLKEVDVFAELSRADKVLADTLDRLGGLYLGSPAKLLQRARDDYAETVLRITGPWKQSKSQTDVIKLAASELVSMVYQYRYDAIDAQTALKELGWQVPKEQAKVFLKQLLPPTGEFFLSYALEDPRIAALKTNKLALGRAEWDLAKAFAAYRAMKVLEKKKEIPNVPAP